MRDQATELRKLVLQSMRETSNRLMPAPRLIVVSGSQEGVGVTTLAINLSVAFAIQGARVVLVDAERKDRRIASSLGIEVASGANPAPVPLDIHELLVRGPTGVLVVPELWTGGAMETISEAAQFRVLHQLQKLGRHAEMVLLDVGSENTQVVHRFWKAADSVVLVTTPDAAAVMNAYSAIKRCHTKASAAASIHLIVNQADSMETANDVFRRIDHSCQRFLGLRISLLGGIPLEPQFRAAQAEQVPFLLHWPQNETSKALERLAATFQSCERRNAAGQSAA